MEPGMEMKTAIVEAKKLGLPIVLIDREIGTTLKRVYHNVPFWKRIYLVTGLLTSVLSRDKVSEEEIEKLKSGDILETTFAQFSEGTKDLFTPLIDERDKYMAAKLLQAIEEHKGNNILVVIGAGHMKGMQNYLENKTLNYQTVINLSLIHI